VNERYYTLSEVSELFLEAMISWFISPVRRFMFILYILAAILFTMLERMYLTGYFLALSYICMFRVFGVIYRRYGEWEEKRRIRNQ
jgi:hypothetical protein